MMLFDPKADSVLPDETLRNRKERYRHLNNEGMGRAAVLEGMGTYPTSISSLEGGSNAMDHVVLVATLDTKYGIDTVIVRLNTGPEPERQFLVEERLYALWRAAGVRVPHLYRTHVRHSSEAFDYMLMERVGDGTLETVSAKDAPRALRAAGAYLAELHQLSLPKFGPLELVEASDSLQGYYDSWRESIEAGIPDTLSYLIRENLITIDQAERITTAFALHAPLLNTTDNVVLHGDYHPGNILIHHKDMTVAGAVDLSQAKSGDRVFDLAFFSTYEDTDMDAFLEGYQQQHALPQDTESRMCLYRLRILISKAKLRKRFGYEERIPSALRGIEDAVRKLM